MSDQRPSRDAALFLQLVIGLSQSAMMALGKLKNPITNKVETDLEAARDTIDTLAAIDSRTRGNLPPEEGRVLQQALASLRLNYVDVMKQGAGASSPASPEAAPSPESSESPPPS